MYLNMVAGFLIVGFDMSNLITGQSVKTWMNIIGYNYKNALSSHDIIIYLLLPFASVPLTDQIFKIFTIFKW